MSGDVTSLPLVLPLNSAIVAKMVALELLERKSELPDAIQTYIDQESAGTAGNPAGLTNRFSGLVQITVDLSRLVNYTSVNLNNTWEQKALSFLLVRQASYPLLKQLVPGISRQEISKLRTEVGAVVPVSKPPSVPDSDLEDVFKAWRIAAKEFDRPIEQWVDLARRLPQWPLSSLYQVLVIEGAKT
jgi:hypothetical protein